MRSHSRTAFTLLAVLSLLTADLFLQADITLACDPLGCLVTQKDQDLLALVRITGVNDKEASATVEHVHSTQFLLKPKQVRILLQPELDWGLISPAIGDHYFVSLVCPENVCRIQWGAWQTDSGNYKTTKLLNIHSPDHAAVQWLMNGRGSSFYGSKNRMIAVTAEGECEIYPRNLCSLSAHSEKRPTSSRAKRSTAFSLVLATLITRFIF